jgi:hypothetical protein
MNDIRIRTTDEDKTEESIFIEDVVDILDSSYVIEDMNIKSFTGRGRDGYKYKIDGYYFDSVDYTCVLLSCDYDYEDDVSNITETDLKKQLTFMKDLVDFSFDGYILNESKSKISSAYSFAQDLDMLKDKLIKFKFVIITNKKLSNQISSNNIIKIKGFEVDLDVWDIKRLYNMQMSKEAKEIIQINFEDYHRQGLACIKCIDNDDYKAYLAVIDGYTLARIYDNYGARLLEGNVRSFLSNRGKVNKCIKKTILHEPDMFFAYNNGIAATAINADVETINNQLMIKSITDLQIINGGQTTASIANTLFKDKASLNDVYIPVKLSIVNGEKSL